VDAKVEMVRDGGRGVSKALVIAHGVHEAGRREILGTFTEGCGTRRSFP
jgi:putative transposase